MKIIFLIFLGFCISLTAYATHNRAGEITYTHTTGLEYKITVTTYTKESAPADRPWLKIRWGDEASNTEEADLDSLPRSNGNGYQLDNDVQMNIYEGFHTYSGPGTFHISVEDPNRNSGVLNINNGGPDTPESEKTSVSVMAVFAIESILVIRPGNNGHNNSIRFLNLPLQDACTNKLWIHNPVAYDTPDGDELVFSLVPCLGEGIVPLFGWETPDDYTDSSADSFVIDPQTGDITWDKPLVAGEYNIAILVSEYRNGLFVGSVVRDMQITVVNCINIPPVINELQADYCVEAGGSLEIHVQENDANTSDAVMVDALGAPLTAVANNASWNGSTRDFSWQPKCAEVRLQPYYVSFIATDNGNIPLSDVETISITVVAPSVENPQAIATGNQINLSWDVTPCYDIFPAGDLGNVKYLIYRRNNLYNFTPDLCELGVPGYTGYTLIGQTQGANGNSFTDNNVYFGGVYCYMIVTVWPDGALSYASEEFCDSIKKVIPVMTKVSVGLTDISAGLDTIHWSKPTDLDTMAYPGPYTYQLFHGEGFGTPTEIIYETNTFASLFQGDTTFIDSDLNTADQANNYKVGIYSVLLDSIIAFSSEASSPFLQLTPGDNQMQLTIINEVPWTDFSYQIWKKAPGEIDFIEIATVAGNNFIDTNLINNQTYCYKVLVSSTYNAGDVPDPLYNWSQEECSVPYDQTPPCPPEFDVQHDCEEQLDELTWINNDECANDVTGFNIYYTPLEGGEMELIAHISSSGDSTYIFTDDEDPISIAGCFAITALDSLNLWPDGLLHQNESAFSEIICVDNCPIYFLPNIFSPNADGLNDQMIPFAYRYIESVDIKIYNRWGNLVFETTDPDINWDGHNKDSGNMSSDAVYYYVAKVNTIRLAGIVTEEFQGTIRLIDSKKSGGTN